MYRFVLLAILIFPLAACFGVYRTPAPRSVYLQEPKVLPLDARGHVHQGSGLEFPPKAGALRLTEMHQYDVEGHNLSGAYSALLGTLQFTLYVYPGPQMRYMGANSAFVKEQDRRFLEGHFEQVVNEVTAHRPRITREYDLEVETSLGPTLGRGWNYPQRALLGEVQSHTRAVVILHQGKWLIKIRASAPADCENLLDREMRALIQALESQAR
ncbi:MAG: hypothetical protein KF858_05490 [Candidatus Sumerlaeia bacterium]|nr:hypothetical protein [Candidatus Sumerlaeia bacterium]